MNANEIRKMTREEIEKQIAKLYEELVQVRDSIHIGKEKDSSKSLKIKRNIARMQTVLSEGSEASPKKSKSKSSKK